MENIDLATTRLADKLQGAVSQDIYAIANSALTHEAERYGLTKPVTVTNVPEYKSTCSICKMSGVWILALVVLFFLVR